MDPTQTMERLTASADTANQAAETALLASEGVIALSTRVSDEVRSAVEQAIRSATPPAAPRIDDSEERKESPLKAQAPLIAGLLTLCGVAYLSLQNSTLTEQLTEQQQQLTLLEEQLQTNLGESGTQVMLLAEQNQRIEEAIKATEEKIGEPAPAPVVDNSAQIAALTGLSDKIAALEGQLATLQQPATPAAEATPTPPVAESTTAPAPVATVSIDPALTLEAVRGALQDEIAPLQRTMHSIKEQVTQRAVVESAPITFKKPKAKSKQPKAYRFP